MVRGHSPIIAALFLFHTGQLAHGAPDAGSDIVLDPARPPQRIIVTPAKTVIVPAGSFPMGASPEALKQARALCENELRSTGALVLEVSPRCASKFDSEAPELTVALPAFAIDRTEVTLGAYVACVRQGKCRPLVDLRPSDDPELPVERVTWFDAQAFCTSHGGRLPTEAQWEKAARSFTHRSWPWGSLFLSTRANHGQAELMGPSTDKGDERLGAQPSDADGFVGRAKVGSFPRGESPYGLLDMAGNVAEWTDGYFSREPPQTTARWNPLGPAFATVRTVRGGSYRSPPSDLRVTRRTGVAPSERLWGLGFRCAYEMAKKSP